MQMQMKSGPVRKINAINAC